MSERTMTNLDDAIIRMRSFAKDYRDASRNLATNDKMPVRVAIHIQDLADRADDILAMDFNQHFLATARLFLLANDAY